MILQILILTALLTAFPAAVGCIYEKVNIRGSRWIFRWISGQMTLWAGFQVICVPMILRKASLTTVVTLFGIYSGALLLLSLGTCVRRFAEGEQRRWKPGLTWKRDVVFMGLIAAGLFLFQLVQAVRLAYGDGDDAYYVAVSTAAENSDKMYVTLPYTGLTTDTDLRHGLAPFPIWIAVLAKISGLPAVTTAHLILPVLLIAMGYGGFALIGAQLFEDRERSLLFLVFMEILVMFGGYSLYTAENFMIARSRQGKAALGSLIIPFLFMLLLYLLKGMEEKKEIHGRYYLLLLATMVSGCLCSTLGALLCCMLVGLAGVLGFCVYRTRQALFLLPCCLPCIGYALLYLLKS